MAFGSFVEISVPISAEVTHKYYGVVNVLARESGSGKDFIVTLSTDAPGFKGHYLNLRRECVKEWIAF